MARIKAFKLNNLARILETLPPRLQLPMKTIWLDYDKEADVLYLSFQRSQKATDSELRDDGIIVRRRGKEIVGLTILDAATR